MNDYVLAALLGIVEGLTEFLPVSSTAHLRIVEALLGVDLGIANIAVDSDGEIYTGGARAFSIV